ncbi:MAG: response regulator [Dehalococcoidia bacterium]
MNPIRILLVDDEQSIRRGLRMRLGLEPDIEVVGEAADGAAAVVAAGAFRPDVVLMDVEMPVMDGIRAAAELHTAAPAAAVVMLSLHDDARTRARARAAGAVDFVAKHEIDAVLTQAIRAAVRRRPESGSDETEEKTEEGEQS